MASIKSRVNSLERSSKAKVLRVWTDAERAVRLFHILSNPERLPSHGPLIEILKQAFNRDHLPSGRPGSSAPLSLHLPRSDRSFSMRFAHARYKSPGD